MGGIRAERQERDSGIDFEALATDFVYGIVMGRVAIASEEGDVELGGRSLDMGEDMRWGAGG
jgi:hypothetical protein